MVRYTHFLVFAVVFLVTGCRTAQETVVVTDRPLAPATDTTVVLDPEPIVDADTVQTGRFDYGKMWTFENPPVEYFEEAYGFRPDSAWFDRARLGALRFSTYCSASFVSRSGLILTNNHCARESVEEVSRSGEDLLTNGFYAAALSEERIVPELHVDQLIGIEDVTPRIARGLDAIQDVERRAQLRQTRIDEVSERMTADAQRRDSSLVVEVVSLYGGGEYAAYTFRRYDDVRLVFSTEHRIGYFGGDYDNFTYPRYNLDYAFLRAYDDAGAPLRTEEYFPWNEEGAAPGEAVFVVGNPGSTSRLKTVAQLEYERDHELPYVIDVIERRASMFAEYIEENPEEAEETKVRSNYLSLTNQIKSQRGQLEGLQDPYLMARRRAGEREVREAIAESDTLQERYGEIFDQIEDVQRSARATSRRAAAFAAFGSPADSQILTRALYGYMHSLMRQRGFPQESIDEMRTSARETPFYPAELERRLFAARLEDMRQFLGASDATVTRSLGGSTPEEVAGRIVGASALNDSLRFEELFEEGFLESDDAAVDLINAIGPAYLSLAQQINALAAREDVLTARLAQARRGLFGTTIPPDASFSLRIADGVVMGYPYNGTQAPPYTSIAGLYERHFAFQDEEDWELPERWLDVRNSIDLSVPMNLATTNDITGGNSGSPLLNEDLQIVGLAFDSNIDALPNEYIYLDDRPRAISVDARGILESLRVVYRADALVDEIRTGEMSVPEGTR